MTAQDAATIVEKMTRLFDSASAVKEKASQREERARIRQRAEEVEAAIQDLDEMDAASKSLRKQLSSAQAVQPIVYAEYRRPGKRWMIEHARSGNDYVYQLFPMKPPTVGWKDIIFMMIAAMDAVFPRSVNISYTPPNEEFKVKFYTLKISDVAGLPGWETACCERALAALVEVDAWQ